MTHQLQTLCWSHPKYNPITIVNTDKLECPESLECPEIVIFVSEVAKTFQKNLKKSDWRRSVPSVTRSPRSVYTVPEICCKSDTTTWRIISSSSCLLSQICPRASCTAHQIRELSDHVTNYPWMHEVTKWKCKALKHCKANRSVQGVEWTHQIITSNWKVR